MKKIPVSTVSSILWKSVAVFVVVVAAGVLGVVVAGVFAYRQLSGGTEAAKTRQAHAHVEPLASTGPAPALASTVQPVQNPVADHDGEAAAANRFVAEEPSDHSHFSYADYHIDVSRVPMATFVRGKVSDILPPPLSPAAEAPSNSFADERHLPSLSDPGSHYIIDSKTGRVVGIDGTAGAASEARQQRQRTAQFPPPARSRPVLAAIPVDAPAEGDLPPPKPDLYVPVRRALPVIEISPGQPFSAADEVADDPRPVMRAEPVIIAPAARPARRVIPFP